MGLVVRSIGVKQAARAPVQAAHASAQKSALDAAAAADVDASAIETKTRETQVDGRVLATIFLFLAFIIIAGIVTEYFKIPEWGGRLVTVFNVLWPFVFGYIGGEFVAEKTK